MVKCIRNQKIVLNLRSLRKDRMIEAAEMAWFLGVNRDTYWRLERMDTDLKANQLLLLAWVFDVPLDDLLYLEKAD